MNLYNKTINKLFEELQHFDPKDYLKNNYKEFMIPLNQYLQLLLEDKGLTKLDVIRRSQMDRHYAYHIFSGTRQNPSRNKVLALANAMRLNLDETQDLLQHSRHCKLCPRSPTDSIIIYAIHQNLDIIKTNSLLEQFGLIDCLG